MAYGFYVTARGLEKIRAAMQDGGKVAINQYAVGDGADIAGERIERITALNNELWRKTLDERDTFEAEGSRLTIKTVIPETAPSMVFNEVGYFDEEDELIIYGTMGDTVKGESTETAPQVLEHDNVLEFSGNEIDAIRISIGNEELADLIDRVRLVEENKADKSELETLKSTITTEVTGKLTSLEEEINSNVTTKLSELESADEGINGKISSLESGKADKTALDSYLTKASASDTYLTKSSASSTYATKSSLDNKVDKVSGKALSSNDFTTTYKNQIDTNKSNISSVTSRVSSLESQLSGLATTLEALI